MKTGWNTMSSFPNFQGTVAGYSNGSRNRMSENPFSASKKKKGGIRAKIKFNASDAMRLIAQAKTKTQVAAIERFLRAKLQEAKWNDSDAATLRAIKKSVSKAAFKVKALGKEERLENMRKAANGGGNLREEERLREELFRKQRVRKRREKADIIQAKLEDAGRAQERKEPLLQEEEYRERLQELLLKESDVTSTFDTYCKGIEPSQQQTGTGIQTEGNAVDLLL